MGTVCGWCFRMFGYILVAVVAVIVYFHLECLREKAGEEEKDVANPDVTDVADTPFGFVKFGEDFETYFGLDFIFAQYTPCAILKLLDVLGLRTNYIKNKEIQNVTIYDARKTKFGSFEESGFTLIKLEVEHTTTDWRTVPGMDPNADIKKFHQEMEPHIMKLYPQTKRMKWSHNVVRGGDKFTDQSVVNGSPHLDYHQNATARLHFHKKYPIDEYWMPEVDALLLMGKFDNEEGKLGILLGVWKPIHPTAAVCDFPLAVMDATTFDAEHQGKNELHASFGVFDFHNLNGAVHYSPKQKWAYYSFQTTKEVLVFHQYSNHKFLANPHTSFYNKNCPQGSQTRVSVEFRVALYF